MSKTQLEVNFFILAIEENCTNFSKSYQITSHQSKSHFVLRHSLYDSSLQYYSRGGKSLTSRNKNMCSVTYFITNINNKLTCILLHLKQNNNNCAHAQTFLLLLNFLNAVFIKLAKLKSH
jgi:hypothetical protein